MNLNLLLVEDTPPPENSLHPLLHAMGNKVLPSGQYQKDETGWEGSGRPDLMILNLEAKNRDNIFALNRLEPWLPILLVMPANDFTGLESPIKDQIYSLVSHPVTSASLQSAMKLALRHSQREKDLKKQIHTLRQTLYTRKRTERAKGVLMDSYGLSEQEAEQRLEALARKTNLDMLDVARRVLDGQGEREDSLNLSDDGKTGTTRTRS